MRTYYIYRATNKITQESYIGQTNNFHLHEPLERTCELVPGRRKGEIRKAPKCMAVR